MLFRSLGVECLLVKDVPAIHAPAAAHGAQTYAALQWDDLLALDSQVVQAKAVRFARDHALVFRVGSASGEGATLVGPAPSCLHTGGDADGLT